MKRQLFALTLLVFGASSAFASTEVATDMATGTVIAAAANPKVAIVSIYCNKEIAAGDFTGMGAAITKLANDEDFDLRPMVTRIHEKVFSEYTSNLEFDFMTEEEVLNNPKYDETIFEAGTIKTTAEQRDKWMLRPDGYLPIHAYPGKKILRETAARFPTADGIMFVSLSYELEKVGMEIMGFGNAKIKCIGTIRIMDKDGKKLLRITEYSSSDNKIKFAMGGLFETSELMPLCTEATEAVFKQLDAKILKKNARGKK